MKAQFAAFFKICNIRALFQASRLKIDRMLLPSFCKMSVNLPGFANCFKSITFRRDFQKILSELREIPDNCRRSVFVFPQTNFQQNPKIIFSRIFEKFENFAKSGAGGKRKMSKMLLIFGFGGAG